MVFSRAPLQGDVRIGVKPRFTSALEEAGEELFTGCVKELGQYCHMEEQSAVVNDFEFLLCEKPTTDGVVHNEGIVNTLTADSVGVIEIKAPVDGVEKLT